MASNNVLSRYRSISRPSLGSSSGGFSSFATSAVKKQNSAEDAIVDSQYETGQISAETYRLELTKRLSRDYITPLQRVTIEEKIGKVGIALQDSEVDRRYQAGEYSTSQVQKYEEDKLNQISQTDTVAYNKQLQKVNSLKDKAEREARTAFRVKENLRISGLPEDTSERMEQKASLYANLEAQARVDGDNQSADTFAAQKNNYLQGAKRAGINDLITNTKLSVSQTPDSGLGVPDAGAGANLYSQLTGSRVPGSAVAGGSSTVGASTGNISSGGGVSTGFSFSSPGMKNSFESLDRSQKRINSLYQQRSDKEAMIQTYQTAIGRASGDQKTQLQIALNNLVDDVKGIDNNIALTTSGIEDTVIRIQEQQAKAAAQAFSQEVRVNNQAFTKAETELETALAKGKINKQEYIQKGVQLAATKAQFFSQASDGFSQFGNDSSAESYLQKADDIEQIHQSLIGVADNLNDYELMAVDPGGKITNLLGKGLKPGDFALTNVRQLKDRKVFDSNYVRVGNAYHRVHYPGEVSDESGFPLNPITDAELAQIRGTAFIYQPDKNGKVVQAPVEYATYKGEDGSLLVRAMTKKDADSLLKNGILINDPKKGLIEKPKLEPSVILKAGAALQQTLENTIPGFKDAGEVIRGEKKDFESTPAKIVAQALKFNQDFSPQGLLSRAAKPVTDFIQKNVLTAFNKPNVEGLVKGAGDFLGQAAGNAGKFVGSTVDAISKFFVPKAEAATKDGNIKITPKPYDPKKHDGFVEGTPTELEGTIATAAAKYGVPTNILSALLKQESGFNPDALSPAGAVGIAQIVPKWHPGVDASNPTVAIDYAAKLIAGHLKQFGGDMKKALAAYNAGGGAVRQYGGVPPYAETQNYVKKILESSKTTFGSTKAFAAEPTKAPKPTAIPTAKPTIAPTKAPVQPGRLNSDELVSPIPDSMRVQKIPYGVVSPSPYVQPRSFQEEFFQNPVGAVGTAASQGIQNIQSGASNAVNQAVKNVQNSIKLPQIQLPKITVPKPVQQVAQNVAKTVQQAPKNIVNTVQAAVKNVSNFVGGLLGGNKKKK